MRRAALLVGILVVGLGSSVVAQNAAGGSTDNRLQRIEEALATLSKQVADLTSQLRPPAPSSPVETVPGGLDLGLTGVPRKGSPDSKIILVEFSDFQCPFCAQHARATYQEIQAEYVNTGKIQYAFRHFPLEHIHPAARQAAEAAVCVGEQGKFWEFHDRLFLNPKALAPADLKEHAKAVKADPSQYETCLGDSRASGRVTNDVADARRLGLRATPAFVIGELQADGNVRVSHRIVGARPLEVFKLVLDELLAPKR